MGKYFGTDGFRGKAGEDLRSEHAFKIGRYLGWYYGQKHPDGERARIVIGKDTRRSSYTFENALAAGITASGADAYLLAAKFLLAMLGPSNFQNQLFFLPYFFSNFLNLLLN